MDDLIFLGNGSAFNYEAYNTAAYMTAGRSLILFDCGEGICNRLIECGAMRDVENIYVFITHLHSDHIGSLEALIYYNQKFLKKNFYIFYPRRSKLKKLLKLSGVDFPFKIYPVPKSLEGFGIDCVEQNHIPGSFGYFFYGKFSFFFSGDTCTVNARAVAELKSGALDRVYHEATCSASPIHTHIDKLNKAFPPELRGKVCLMHFDNPQFAKECAESGYAVAEVTK